jgi:hypothetical protein
VSASTTAGHTPNNLVAMLCGAYIIYQKSPVKHEYKHRHTIRILPLSLHSFVPNTYPASEIQMALGFDELEGKHLISQFSYVYPSFV